MARSRLARRIVIRKSWQVLGFAQKQPFSDAVKQVFYRTCGWQVKDDAIFVLFDLHGDFEQFQDDRARLCG